MRLNLLAVSLLALSLSLPAMAADIVIDESGGAGEAGGAGENGGNGGHGTSQSMVVNTMVAQSGEDGEDGDTGEAGGNGEAGGDVNIIIDTPTTDGIVISVDGGNGATGGTGGNGGKGGMGGTAIAPVGDNAKGGDGGDGGDGGIGGVGGDGGAGGEIDLVVSSAVGGDIVLSAVGGDEGEGGVGGDGGDDGIGGFAAVKCALAFGGAGGSGGDGNVGGSAGVGGGGYNTCEGSDGYAGVVHGSFGSPGDDDYWGKFRGADGQEGAGGSITVALSAAVGGSVTANAGTGDISVTLNTGASVGGTIAANAAATSALRFAMTVSSKEDYRAAKAYLGDAANALSGSLTINGQTFSWTGFDQLVEALKFAGVRAAAGEASGPTYLACSPRAVTAFHKDGGIELIARRTAERGAFRIGTITGQSFSSQNDVGWTVRFEAAGKSFDVLDRAGEIVATCRR